MNGEDPHATRFEASEPLRFAQVKRQLHVSGVEKGLVATRAREPAAPRIRTFVDGMTFPSPTNARLEMRGIAVTVHLDLRCRVRDRAKVGGGQLNTRAAEVLLETMELRRARNRDDPWLLRE